VTTDSTTLTTKPDKKLVEEEKKDKTTITTTTKTTNLPANTDPKTTSNKNQEKKKEENTSVPNDRTQKEVIPAATTSPTITGNEKKVAEPATNSLGANQGLEFGNEKLRRYFEDAYSEEDEDCDCF
jgi:hypothetical protein